MAPRKWRSGKAKPSLLKRLQIAQAKGKQRKKEVRKYLIAYRSTPHTTTRVSPAELLFGRKIRTKLPEFHEERVVSEVQDRDGEMKVKAKSYADRKRHAEYSDLVPGNRVLLKQEKQNKLSTPFAPEPYAVVGRNGSSFTIKSTEVVWLKRKTAHVKKYVQEDVQAESPNLTRLSATYLETDGGKEKNAVSKRPALTDLETDCGKFRTATDDDHLQDQLVKRSYQRTLSVLAQMSGVKGDVST